MANPFKEETQSHKLVMGINYRLREPDRFWESEEDHFVSLAALQKGVDIIEVVMTREQFEQLLGI